MGIVRRLAILIIVAACTPVWAEGEYGVFSDPGQTHTHRLGRQKAIPIERRHNVSPMFVFALDEPSIKWIKHHAIYFRRINAIGFVMNQLNADELNRLRDEVQFKQIFYLPNAGMLLSEFGVSHYPVLIDSGNGMVRQ